MERGRELMAREARGGTDPDVSSCARSRGGRAVLSKCPALAGAALALLLLGGCARGDAAASLEPRAELAQKAVLAAADHVAGTPAATAGAAEGDELTRVDDPRGDQGHGPRYADLSRVVFTDSGQGLDVSLTLAAPVPARLANGELEEVGVEIYRTSPLETLLGRDQSDYQVRLQGGREGWRAFLHTQDGYVDFPGTFSVAGRTLRVVLPWEAVGGRKRAQVEAYADWSSGVGRLSTDGSTRVRLDAH